MELYDVTVWDVSGSKDFEGWIMESPPVRVKAIDSYSAALKVAKRADPKAKLEGIRRPEESKDVFFKDEYNELVFQVSDTFIKKPPREYK